MVGINTVALFFKTYKVKIKVTLSKARAFSWKKTVNHRSSENPNFENLILKSLFRQPIASISVSG